MRARTRVNRTGWLRAIGSGVLVCTLTACNPGADAANAVEDIKARACQCSDNACAKAVAEDFVKLAKTLENAPLSAAHASRVTDASRESTICLLRLGVNVTDEAETR